LLLLPLKIYLIVLIKDTSDGRKITAVASQRRCDIA